MRVCGYPTGSNLKSKMLREEMIVRMLPATKEWTTVDFALLNDISQHTARHYMQELKEVGLIEFKNKLWRRVKNENHQ